jgi:hypothetical protein
LLAIRALLDACFRQVLCLQSELCLLPVSRRYFACNKSFACCLFHAGTLLAIRVSLATCFTPVSCLAYSSNIMIEAIWQLETSIDFIGLHNVMSQKTTNALRIWNFKYVGIICTTDIFWNTRTWCPM